MLSLELQKEIYDILKKERLIERTVANRTFMDIVSSIWNVYEMPATGEDRRYKDYGKELNKHFVLNDDWDIDFVFISHLKLFANEDVFRAFFLRILENSDFNLEQDDAKIQLFRNALEKEGLYLHAREENGRNVFELDSNKDENQNVDKNVIPFFVVENKSASKSSSHRSHDKPTELPCFVLVFNDGWNDYSCYSWFSLFYYPVDSENGEFIGDVKIIKFKKDNTFDNIDKKFYCLSKDYCSLGRDVSYYAEFRRILGDKAWNILKALRDATCFPENADQFNSDPNFRNSLCRENRSERALREGFFYTAGRDMTNSYGFTYKFHPKYGKEYTSINFDFKYKCESYQRVIGLIGENGVGKTTLLQHLPEDLSNKREDVFEGELPLFSKIIVVSYSPFDRFVEPVLREGFNYVYCGLMKNKNELFSKEEQIDHLKEQINTIHSRGLLRKWSDLLAIIINADFLENFITEDEYDDSIDINTSKLTGII